MNFVKFGAGDMGTGFIVKYCSSHCLRPRLNSVSDISIYAVKGKTLLE